MTEYFTNIMLVWNQYFRVKGLARSAREATVEESGETAKTQGQGQLERRSGKQSRGWETKGQGQLERRPGAQLGETG